jgi:hypothetical protein
MEIVAKLQQLALDVLSIAVKVQPLGQLAPPQPVELLLSLNLGPKHRQVGRFPWLLAFA